MKMSSSRSVEFDISPPIASSPSSQSESDLSSSQEIKKGTYILERIRCGDPHFSEIVHSRHWVEWTLFIHSVDLLESTLNSYGYVPIFSWIALIELLHIFIRGCPSDVACVVEVLQPIFKEKDRNNPFSLYHRWIKFNNKHDFIDGLQLNLEHHYIEKAEALMKTMKHELNLILNNEKQPKNLSCIPSLFIKLKAVCIHMLQVNLHASIELF